MCFIREEEISLQLIKLPTGVCLIGMEYSAFITTLLRRNKFAGIFYAKIKEQKEYKKYVKMDYLC